MACIICNSEENKEICSYSQPDMYERAVGITEQGYSRKWVKCISCGLSYSVYSRNPESMDRIYESAYRDSECPWRKQSSEEIFEKITKLPKEESETKFRIEWIKRSVNDLRKHEIIPKKEGSCNLLDIGGGTGIFAFEFQDDEWISYVIDPDKGAEFIDKKLNIPFMQKYYEPRLFGKKFELISLIFVLEHIKNPAEMINKTKQDMDEGSLLYIEVPDEICFRKKPFDDDIFNSCHLFMFNPSTITRLLDECGLEIYTLKRIKTIRGHYSLMLLAGKNGIHKKES